MSRGTESSLGDRIVTAILAAVFAASTCVLLPVVVTVHSGITPVRRLWYDPTFWAWVSVVSAGACIAGFLLGSTRAASMFGHLWGTEVPARPSRTFCLWLV